ncbi:MAG: hypothetical protein QM757_24650 [Paludibaculum sp.]
MKPEHFHPEFFRAARLLVSAAGLVIGTAGLVIGTAGLVIGTLSLAVALGQQRKHHRFEGCAVLG